MKKSSFIAMILGTIGGFLFALGMCMALIAEWDAFTPGVIVGTIGVIVILITVLSGERWSIRSRLHYPEKLLEQF